MKRIIVIFFTTLISFNVGGVILWLRKYGVDIDFDTIFKIHYEISNYAIKISLLGVVVDWIYKRSEI